MVMTKGELTRQQILGAAIARFGREGYRATSVADIARDAGVSGTAAYAYFDSKEALFLAAADEDVANLIAKGAERFHQPLDVDWRQTVIFTLVAEVDGHPLARRLLSGLEPDVSERVLELPALAEMRKACVERLRAEQAKGAIRPDIDAETIGEGVVAIILSLLMSVVQLGPAAAQAYGASVAAVFQAALEPPA
jgi:AcrR family transcriptional regulator